MALVTLPILLINICISSAMIQYKGFAEKDVRVPASVVFDNYGILLCAKQCELSGMCVAVNFNPSLFLCELVFGGSLVSYKASGWLHFKDLSQLQEAGIPIGIYKQTCQSMSSVLLSSGNIHCIEPEDNTFEFEFWYSLPQGWTLGWLEFNIHATVPIDCQDIQKSQLAAKSGIYRIFVTQSPLDVFCNMVLDGGGWTTIQARKDGSENFYRTWSEYKVGFGNVHGEMWLGNDNLHALLSKHPYKLRVDMEDFEGNRRYAEYNTFSVANENGFYAMTACCYSGTAGDSLSQMSGNKFSTGDRDNDNNGPGSCADFTESGWWFSDCMFSNMNGLYSNDGQVASSGKGIVWNTWRGYTYSHKAVSMKVKRRN